MKHSNLKNRSRISALGLLEKQLKSGTKPAKDENGRTTQEQIPLTESNRNRIEREISVLKSRIVNP